MRSTRRKQVAVALAATLWATVGVAEAQPKPADAPTPPPTSMPASPSAATEAPAKPAADVPTKPAADAPTKSPPEKPAPAASTEDEQPPVISPPRSLDHTGTPEKPPLDEATLPPVSGAPGETRVRPSYDGREDPGVSAGEALIWIPRILFYPVHLVLEWGVRWPIITGFTWAEENYIFARVERLFSFRGGKSFLFPTVLFDFGVNPSVGLFFTSDDTFVKGNSLTLQAGVWFNKWLHLIGTDSFSVFRNDAGAVTLRAEFLTRPDFIYHGVGPETLMSDERFFRFRKGEVELSLRSALTDLNRFTAGIFYRNGKITDGTDFSDEQSISTDLRSHAKTDCPNAFDEATKLCKTKIIPGAGVAYNMIELQLKAEIDTRSPDRVFTPGSGARLEVFGGFAIDPSNTDLHYARYGAEAAGFLDLTGINHVLALRVYVEIQEQTGDVEVPITERLFLGGPEHMRAFLAGRVIGDSAFVTTLSYRYPIWVFLDANVFVGLGNTFKGRFEQFHVERMLFNWGIGLRSNTSREVSFDLMVAFGSNQIGCWKADKTYCKEKGFDVDNVRFVFGVNQGF